MKYKAMSWMTGIIHEPMTFILDTCRLYHTSGKQWKMHSAITVKCKIINKNNNSCFKIPGKRRPWESDPTPLEIASSWTPFPLEFLMPSVGGSINRILVWRVTVSIFSWTYAGIHVIPPGVTASFSLNFLNSFNIVVKCTCIFCWH